jgi:hypothetical protein
MMTDAFLRLEDGTTMTTFSATALSTAWLDFGSVVEDIGRGRNLYLNIAVTTACTGVGTVEFQAVAQPVTTLAAMTFSATFFTGSANIVTATAHGLSAGTPIILSATGGAPGGVTLGVTYFVTAPTANTFQLSTTLAVALTGTADVTISSAGTTTHTMVVPPLVLGSSGQIPIEMLKVGSVVRVRINPILSAHYAEQVAAGFRYFFAKYVEGTASAVAAAVTAGKWIVDVTDGIAAQKHYPSGFTLS